MLQRLRVRNFRLLRDVEVTFEHPLTVFIGPNSSGKSTILEVLDFLSRCASDGLQEAVTAHGGFESIRTIGTTEPIEIALELQYEDGTLAWELAIQSRARDGVAIVKEDLKLRGSEERHLVQTDENGGRRVRDEDIIGIVEPHWRSVKDARTLAFKALVDPEKFDELELLRSALEQIRVVGSIPAAPLWARADHSYASPRDSLVIGPQSFLGRQGLGLANVLYNLYTHDEPRWTDLLRDFQAEFPFCRRIIFPADVSGARISFAVDDQRFRGRPLFASELSDGAVVYLCLLAALAGDEHFGALGLDEPDANLHPSALRRLLSRAQQPNDQRKVIAVTHSTALLDHLEDPASSIRIVEATEGGAVIRKLDREALETWREEYSLSDMRRTGLLDSPNTAYEGKR